ncbi:MAG TPA: transglutaminase [Clostridiales bacterium]|nr:transglutaminase [Clostridiales bacterium]
MHKAIWNIGNKKDKIVIIFLPLAILVLLAAAFPLNKVHRTITLEAGSDTPEFSRFIKDEATKGEIITDLSKINMSEPGDYRIKIKIGALAYHSKLKIRDTIPPTANISDLEIPLGKRVEAKDFVSDITDVTQVTVSFLEEPDFDSIGEQDVGIVLEDAGRNRTVYTAKLYIGKVYRSVAIELGTERLDISDFLMDDVFKGSFITDISNINLKEPGTHNISLEVDGDIYSSQLEIIDTTPPKANVINQVIWVNDKISPDVFVKNIFDYSDVKVFFGEEPDFSLAGMHKVSIILEDTSKNRTEMAAYLTIREDTEPPVIEGVEDITVYVDERVSYRRNVRVTDNRDAEVELIVDSSKVNLKKEGKYEVTYIATDTAGNTATETITITVLKKPWDYVDPEELDKLADSVLDMIIKDGMSDKEKLKAIFQWTKKRISYTGSTYKKNWMWAAVQGIKKGSGDCFTYYGTARALLTRAGFENLCVTRIDNTHYWNLVKYNGNWYHFDTCPHSSKYPFDGFLRTDAEVAEYSKKRKDKRNYYTFDKSLYPATPDEPLE